MTEGAEGIVSPEESLEELLPAVGRQWHAAEARVVLEAWRRSGLSLGAFARQHGMVDQRLRYWIGQLAQAEGQAPAAVHFHPVQVVEGRAPGRPEQRIEVVLATGRSVFVPSGFAADDLTRVLAVLELDRRC